MTETTRDHSLDYIIRLTYPFPHLAQAQVLPALLDCCPPYLRTPLVTPQRNFTCTENLLCVPALAQYYSSLLQAACFDTFAATTC
jgi:hypothetical protein